MNESMGMEERILIVEDDDETAAAVGTVVEGTGCSAGHCDTLEGGVAAAVTNPYKVIVLDRMLPGGDGVEAMARIRAGGSTALISRGSDSRKIVALCH